VLGRWLGISHDIGGPLTYFILPKSCKPIARSSVTPVTPEELLEPANKALAEELDKAIDEKIGKFRTDKEVAEELGMLFGPSGDLYDGDLDPFAALMPEADEWTPETFDKYLAAEVLLPHGGELVRAKVTGRIVLQTAHLSEPRTRTPSWILVSTKCRSPTDRPTAMRQT
jgi:hypothetical protein